MHLAWYSWLLGFSLTLLVELPVATWLLKSTESRWWRRLFFVAFASLATHPLVWFFFPKLPLDYPLRLTLSESWAFGAEALFYWVALERLSLRRALLTSLLANGASFTVGWFVVSHFARWFYAP
jgi:hypothetical protein